MEKIIIPHFSLPIKDMAEQATAPLQLFQSSSDMIMNPFFRGVMPLPPSVNDAYKVVRIVTRDGRQVHRLGPTAELDQFKRDASLFLPSSAFIDWSVLHALRATRRKTPLGVRIEAYFLSEWKRDLDGVLKHAIDACFEFLRLNDNQIMKLEAEKFVDAEEPRIEIEVRCIVRS